MIKQMQSQWFLRFALPATLSFTICGLLYLTLNWAALRIDEVAETRQKGLVTLTVSKLRTAIAHDQESATVWDDAVRNAIARNLEWLDTNVGAWMHTYFGHDIALVLSADRNLIYRFSTEDGPRPDDLARAYLPLAERLQERLASGDTEGTNERVLSIGEADLVYVGLRPAIVSVKPIVSDSGEIQQEPGQENLHVAVRFLDGNLPNEIGTEYEFSDLQFSLAPTKDLSRSFVPLISHSGVVLGYFHWIPFRPGSSVLQATAPALVLAFVAIAAAASLFGGMIWRRGTRLASSRAELLHQASHDSLTGLANRAHFNKELSKRLEGASEDKLSVLFVDLDRFKAVNDTFGHPAGDKLITMVATRLRSLLAKALIARIGGDEFTILLEGDDAQRADQIASQIIKCLNQPFDLEGGAHASIGASVGVATSSGKTDYLELTRQADIALYHSKAAGRNTYAIFGSHMDELLQKRRRLEDDLREAVASGIQIQTFYQPVFSLDDGKVASFEALARWMHPRQGFISPEIFIPLAEEMGLIHEVGTLVLRDVCKLLFELPAIRVAINVSVLELSSPGYALRVIGTLAASHIDPNRLEIELTESLPVDKDGHFINNVASLRAAGVSFAIDDFGTGYASFSRVQTIDADRIKIDKSFVDDMDKADNKAIVMAIISMARAKGLKITAEGVETEAQRAALQKLGCDDLQGFLLSRPLSEAAVHLLVKGPERRAVAV
ncbi:EAL domain-containing protein [Rhizobium deserti]|uniref:EAL domain-containing protein n=1 Tax=Rhizobium deserti TaxID=2547961 RepID=A0A4V3APT8_9HYPH|nr:EAL domain-containing protein [Rhizobium deserti]TDK39040.1 EAL domain-containing protein [Rhizobium deserti]